MAWVALAESGYAPEFSGENCSLVGSQVVATDAEAPSFTLGLTLPSPAPVRMRLTWQAYAAGSPYGDVSGAQVFAAGDFIANAEPAGNPQTAFSPAQIVVEWGATNYYPASGSEWSAVESWTLLVEVEIEDAVVSYNCECDDAPARKTLKNVRDDLMRRLGYGAQVNNPPPGMKDLLNSFIVEAQELLVERYTALRTVRFFTWPLMAGVRYYDLPDNAETCTKRLNPHAIAWAGVREDGGTWRPLLCGIPPELYSHNQTGQPERYEIRQCLEIWPAPAASTGSIAIKGRFELEPLEADSDALTIEYRPVFLLALANAKAHYRQPDAGNYTQQLEVYIDNLVAGSHHTRRYVPGRDRRTDMIYVAPRPSVPFE